MSSRAGADSFKRMLGCQRTKLSFAALDEHIAHTILLHHQKKRRALRAAQNIVETWYSADAIRVERHGGKHTDAIAIESGGGHTARAFLNGRSMRHDRADCSGEFSTICGPVTSAKGEPGKGPKKQDDVHSA